jgi:hypothetical protein
MHAVGGSLDLEAGLVAQAYQLGVSKALNMAFVALFQVGSQVELP